MACMEQTKTRRIIAIVTGGVLTVALVGAGVFGLTSIAQAREQAAQQQQAQERADAEQDAFEDKLVAIGAEAVKKQQEADDAAWIQHLADVKAAEEKRVADAQAAEAQRLADEAQAAADAAKAPTKAPSRSSSNSSGVVKCPAGTKANAVDAAGNESACEALGAGGEQCQAYDENNTCTNWYKP